MFLHRGSMLLFRRLRPPTFRNLSIGSISSNEKKLVYEGKFSNKLKWLRRISISSTVVSVFGFPIVFQFGAAASMPLVGQIMIAGTAILTSLSSTIFLQTITSPYVVKLFEVSMGSSTSQHRRFQATKITLFGTLTSTEFDLHGVEKVTSSSTHPFATFRDADNRYYYVFGDHLKDESLKTILGNSK